MTVFGRSWRCFISFLQKICGRSAIECCDLRVSYPRLALPDYNLSFEYDMTHEHRGVALIFNHENYEHKYRAPRKATNVDRDRLYDVLDGLGFDVRIHNDLTFQQIMETLGKGEDDSEYFK